MEPIIQSGVTDAAELERQTRLQLRKEGCEQFAIYIPVALGDLQHEGKLPKHLVQNIISPSEDL